MSAPEYDAAGPASVGVLTTAATDNARGRTLPIEVWYPIESSGTASGVIDFETDPDQRAALSGLLDAAPEACVAKTTAASRDAPASAGEYPLFDRLDGTESPLDNGLVDVREADIRFLLDRVLAGDVLPNGIAANAAQVGMLGHSIGSVTAGRVTQNDARIAAVIGLAAPMENPFYGEVSIEAIEVPLGLLVATEDNSITEVGNSLIRENFSEANTPAYKIELVDAGHWSVTNIAGLDELFAPGCENGTRQTNDEPFTYVSVDSAKGHTATFVTAFFAGHLLNEPSALELLRSNPSPNAAPIEVRE
ncbi:MAG: hypothetical protein WBB42_17245 [Polyangiales bacterium]